MFPVGAHVSLGTSIAGEPAASACMVSTTSPSPLMNLILDLISLILDLTSLFLPSESSQN